MSHECRKRRLKEDKPRRTRSLQREKKLETNHIPIPLASMAKPSFQGEAYVKQWTVIDDDDGDDVLTGSSSSMTLYIFSSY